MRHLRPDQVAKTPKEYYKMALKSMSLLISLLESWSNFRIKLRPQRTHWAKLAIQLLKLAKLSVSWKSQIVPRL